MKFLQKEIDQLEQLIPLRDRKNENVSSVDVAWHLDHAMKTMIAIFRALKASNPEDYRPNVNIRRSYVFATGKIPRGAAKSPKAVLPPSIIETDHLKQEIKLAREIAENVDSLDPRVNVDHPVFGQLNLKHSKRFLEIHTRHHLEIISEIIERK